MFRIIVVVTFALFVAACSDPRQTLLPNNLDQWESDQNFQSSVRELTLEEQNILSTYVMRMNIAYLKGEPIPTGLTIAEAIADQQIYLAEFRAEEERKKAEALAKIRFKEDYQEQQVDILDFEVTEKRSRSGSKIYKVACGAIVNKGTKPLCDLEITIYFLDKNGYKISERVYTPIKALNAKKAEGESYVFKPNKKIKFNYPLVENIPPNWNGMAMARVTNLEFLDDSEQIEN